MATKNTTNGVNGINGRINGLYNDTDSDNTPNGTKLSPCRSTNGSIQNLETSTQPQPLSQPVATPSEVSHFIDTISLAFANTALTTCFITEMDSIPPPYPSQFSRSSSSTVPLTPITSSRRRQHFAEGILSASSSGAELVQAGNWSAVALWEPPNFQGKIFADLGHFGPHRTEWKTRITAAKAKFLKGRKFYHLSFLARNPEVDVVQGAVRAVIVPFLERAKREGVPAWLEATYPRAVAVYERFGFRVVEVVVLGEGKLRSDGWPVEDGKKGNGEGVRGYCMIWEP